MAVNSAISISSDALVLLGSQPISSFTDGSTESLIASQLYETAYHAMLTETLWHFATRSALLAKHEEKPDNGWMAKFQLPHDYLYVVSAEVGNYEIYERDLYANGTEVRIEYVYPVKEENLPASFVKALQFNLAAIFAIPLTGNATRAEYYAALYQDQMRKARRADSSQRPANQMGTERYLNVRNV